MVALKTALNAVFLACVLSDDPSSHLIPTYGEDLLASYSEPDQADLLPGYTEQQDTAVMSGIDMLRMSVPGNPGQDYPIYAQVPDTSFSCDGRVEGGYYADTEGDCQPFHVCSADSASQGLIKFSFLCPNGTLFNQEHFVCEYWFNVDCAAAESFYGLNDNIGTVPESSDNTSPGGYNSPAGAASSPVGYAAPSERYDEPPPPPADQSYSSPSESYDQPPPPPAPPADQTYSSPSEDSYAAPVSEYQQTGGAGGARTGRRGGRLLRRPGGSRQGVRRVKTRTEQRKSPRRPTQSASVKKVQSGSSRTAKTLRTRNKKKKTGRNGGQKTSGRNGRQEPLTSYLPPSAEEPVRGYLPPATEPAVVLEQEESQYDYEYEEAPLPTYNSPAASASSSYASGGGEVVADVSSVADEVYLEDELPTYNNGVYSEGGEGEEGDRYTAPVVDSIPSDSGLEDGDALPTYNNGVYNNAEATGAPAEEYDYQDELPSYNNGVYSEGDATGSRYTAPQAPQAPEAPQAPASSYSQPSAAAGAPTSYGAPGSPPAPTFSPSPSFSSSFQPITAPPAPSKSYEGPSTSIYEAPVPGSYQDPTADILPEYHKSEISLRLNNRNEVPRIEPFQTDFGEPLYIGTYKASGSAPRPAVVPPPSSRVDIVPVVSLSKYNIPEVSDKGFKGLGSSYGR